MKIPKNWSEFNKILPEEVELTPAVQEFIIEIRRVTQTNFDAILDVGCSNGRYLILSKKIFEAKELVGIDIIGFKRKKIKFLIGDCHNLPIKNNSFDLVYSLGLLEHFKKEERVKILREQTRVLKTEGYFLLLIPNCTIGSLRLIKVKFLDFFRDWKHFVMDIKNLRNVLRQLGINIVSEKFLGSSLHLGHFMIPIHHYFHNNQILADDFLIIGKKCDSR